jgi:histidine triad (HIT) family protein
MASIFSRIVNGELPAYILAADELHMAILDINPLVQGHVLVFPKQEVDYLFDLDHDYHKYFDGISRDVAIKNFLKQKK